MRLKLLNCLGTLAVLAAFNLNASAGVFKTITIDDLYDDWIGVPVLDSDPADNPGFVDIADVQIANDNDWLYIRTTYYSELSLGTTIAIDSDNDTSTGFDIFGLGLVGSEAGWQNDFDFDQRAGFNIGTLKDGRGLTEPEDGAGTLSSFANSNTRELAVRLDSFFDPLVGVGDVFQTDSFTLLIWVDGGVGDVSAAIPYTLAIPEPSALVLLLMASLPSLVIFNRRR